MKNLAPDAVAASIRPVLEARMPAEAFHRLFPVTMTELPPLAAAEPSVGALVQLDAGDAIVVTYGMSSGILLVEAATARPVQAVLTAIHGELPLLQPLTTWEAPHSASIAPSTHSV